MKKSDYLIVCLTVLLALSAISCQTDPVVPKVEVNSESTLRDAIANESNSIITLTGDISLSSVLSIDKKVTIDLNGKTIENAASDGSAILVNGGDLTVTGNGTVKAGIAAVQVVNEGKATIESGKYIGTFAVAAGSFNSKTGKFSNGSVVINNGEFEAVEFAVPVWGKSSAVINGGTFSAKDNAVIGTNGSSPLSAAPYEITINGGVFNGQITSSGYIACGIYMANTGKVTLNGGVFNIEGGVGILVRSGELTANKAEINLTPKAGLDSGKIGDSKVIIAAGSSQIVVDDRAGYPGEAPKVAVNKTSYEPKDINGNAYTAK